MANRTDHAIKKSTIVDQSGRVLVTVQGEVGQLTFGLFIGDKAVNLNKKQAKELIDELEFMATEVIGRKIGKPDTGNGAES